MFRAVYKNVGQHRREWDAALVSVAL